MKFNVTLLIIPLITFDILSDEVNDPFENINRNIYVFNEKVDEIILRPSAIFYSNTTPKFLKRAYLISLIILMKLTTALTSFFKVNL